MESEKKSANKLLSIADISRFTGYRESTIRSWNYPFKPDPSGNKKKRVISYEDFISAEFTRRRGKGEILDGEIDPNLEQALEIRASRQNKEIKNKILLREWAPLDIMQRALEKVLQPLIVELDTATAQLKAEFPHIEDEVLLEIDNIFAEARNKYLDDLDDMHVADLIKDSDYD